MPNYVPGIGNPSAKIAIVGEAPGSREDQEKLPFVGASGQILNELLESAGLSRDEVYITNVCKIRPPNNKIKDLHLIGRTLEEFIPGLIEELNVLNPNCVVVLGNTALQTLTGNTGIEHFRGSILPSRITSHKCIATIHPAALLHESGEGMKSWSDLALIRADFKRIAEQSLFPEIRIAKKTLELARSGTGVYRFLNNYNDSRLCAAVDIETTKTVPVCISIAFNNWHAISIPLLDPKIPDLAFIWKLVAEFLGDNKTSLIAQNGKFDTKRCRDVGLTWSNLWFDTMFAWHTLFAELPKSLATISSILTEEPYYKDEGKEYVEGKHNFDRLLSYNAKDAVVTFECYEKLNAMLDEEPNLKDFFFDKVMPLHKLYSDMEDVGILIDQAVRKQLGIKYAKKRKEKHENLVNEIITNFEDLRSTYEKINVNSPKQIANLLYGFLKCPPRKDVQESTLKSLRNNAIKDKRRQNIIQSILEERKISKAISTYINASLCDDGRIRTEMMVVGTESGRTSTQVRKPPIVVFKDGMALQTMTKHEDVTMDAVSGDLRSMFIADPGYSIIEPDLSQAEDRVVCLLSKDYEALKEYDRTEFIYNKHGLKDDRHTKTSMFITAREFDSITDYLRQIGKRIRHAGNYDIGKHEGMLTLARFGIFISEWQVGEYLRAFHQANPKIRNIFHQDIQDTLAGNDCILYSPHGRKRQFFNKWGSELFKEAYSFIPQATISDQVKFALLRIKQKLGNVFFPFLESHDSFAAIILDEAIKPAARIIKQELEVPISFSRCSLRRDYDLVIPCEIKVGKRWIDVSEEFPDGMKKLKEI